MASTVADVVLVTETPPGVENGNTNLAADNEEGLVRAVLAETTSSPTHTDNRFRYAYYLSCICYFVGVLFIKWNLKKTYRTQ